uniref:DUF5753 domain-containing protein n=1 Tax=Haemonchus contortus TaxID=6289 RepID=A0A7I4Y6C1_HAECO
MHTPGRIGRHMDTQQRGGMPLRLGIEDERAERRATNEEPSQQTATTILTLQANPFPLERYLAPDAFRLHGTALFPPTDRLIGSVAGPALTTLDTD